MSREDWIVKVIVPIVSALIGAGAFFRGKDKPSSPNKWVVQVIVPILCALIAAGAIFGGNPLPPPPPPPPPPTPTPNPTSVPSPSPPPHPILHSTYNGTFTNLATQQTFPFSLMNLTEDTNTGDFTASAVDGFCTARITEGNVNTSGKIIFKLVQVANQITGCSSLTASFAGQVNSAGGISGSWTEENTEHNGSFNLS